MEKDKRKRCAVPGCNSPVHARGYCRRHYSQLWRGRRSGSSDDAKPSPRREHIHDDPERIRALERELQKAEHMYEVVVGFEGRVKWRREMEAVRTELRRLGVLASEDEIAKKKRKSKSKKRAVASR